MTAKYLLLAGFLISFTLMLTAQSAEDLSAETNKTSLSFEQTTFNFGDISEGEIIQNIVTFTNTGDEPLIISNAKATCGCTIPMWPKEPIMPGESAELLVQFDSKNKGKFGGKKNSKRVTITANTDPINSYVTITGNVHKTEEGQEPGRHENFDVAARTVKLWPNPTSGIVQLDLSEYAGKSALVEVYSMMGERLETMTIESLTEDVLEIDMSTYDTGIYTFSISMQGHNRIAKTVVVR